MPIEKVLIEYAKIHVQLVVANERIVQLEQQIKEMSGANKPELVKQS